MEPEICGITTASCLSLEKNLFPALAKKGKLFGYYLQEKWFHLDKINKK
jgi:NDP-sugar pyrophosphorylase family protein